jgi:N-acetylglucosaminyl-diphospho-decaprenol L-rhamnosyltransferase
VYAGGSTIVTRMTWQLSWGRPVDSPPDISICIVSTDGREDLLRCLDSVFLHPPTGPFEVLVLDNASTDGTAAAAAAAFGDRVQLVILPSRRGKAENDSDLMARARGRWCLLLNEDSELTPGAADSLRAALEAHPGAAAAGARLVSPAGRAQASAWRFPGPGTALAGALFAHRRLTVQSGGEAVRQVDWVQSAGMLVRRSAFDQVGPLDPSFFVYSDEVDWQRRARDAGWTVLYVADATIMHREQLSADTGSRRRIVEFARNRDAYMRKHHGRLAALAVRVLTAWAYAVRALAALVLPGHSARRYAWHAYHSLFPARGEGLREAAEAADRGQSSGHT